MQKIREKYQAAGRGFCSIYLCDEFFTPFVCAQHPKKVFVFSDNLQREGTGGQACIRHCENSVGIRTKKFPQYEPSAYFTDADFDKFVNYVNHDIACLKDLNKYHPLVFSSHGYGTGLAEMPKRAPNCFIYLCKSLNEFIGKGVFTWSQYFVTKPEKQKESSIQHHHPDLL